MREQGWLVDAVIQSVGLDWDQARSATMIAPCGFSAQGEWRELQSSVKRLHDLPVVAEKIARRRQRRAETALDEGDHVSARESFFVAAMYWGLAQWAIFETSDVNHQYDAAKIHCYEQYAKVADHTVVRLDIPFGDRSLGAWLHLPSDVSVPPPVVIAVPGVDTFKESLVWMYGDRLLSRGLAVLAIDGPGQYETLLRGVTLSPGSFGRAGRSCVDTLQSLDNVDGGSIGLLGRSFGSYAVTEMAAACGETVGAVAGCLPLHEPGFGTLTGVASPTFKERLMLMSPVDNESEFDQWVAGFDVRPLASSISCPYLAVGGEQDELSPLDCTVELLRGTKGPSDMVVYELERHAIGSSLSSQAGPDWHSLAAAWLYDRLVTSAPLEFQYRCRRVTPAGAVEEVERQ